MKSVLFFTLGLLITQLSYSQENSSVTMAVMGNKNLQVTLDGKSHNLNNATVSGDKTSFTIASMEPGTHSFQVNRMDLNTNRSVKIEGEFFLRYGYNMLVNVNRDGSLELIESRFGSAENLTPASTASFNTLLKNVRLQKSVAGRRNVIANAFDNARNSYSTNQVSQLLALVNSESFRLQLAKSAYPIVRDRGNFYQVYSLLNSQASKNELADFVYDFEGSDIIVAMPDAQFNTLYQTIQQQWPVSKQMNSLTTAFSDTNNYFTTAQAGRLIQLMTAESNRLQLAKLSYRSITDPDNFTQIFDLLNSQSSKNELQAYINAYPGGSGPNNPMSDANFNSLYQTIQQQWPVSAQMTSLTNAFNNTSNYFSTYQAGRLIQLVTAENNRLQLAKLSYRSITDKNNFYQIYDLLNTQASKNELQAYVNNYGGATGPNTPMSDANFNSLYQTIQQQWPVSTQMTSLANAFNNTGNYFTTYQAGRLIQLVTAESNRLQLAKLSYRSITDRNNFYQVYDLFSTQASKNELEAYVNSYNADSSSVKTPMSDADFNQLYQTIQMQFLPNEQMMSLTSVFNNTSYYFTTAQVKLLIPLVSLESNRLKLAKLAYRALTDRNNYTQLYDLFINQSSKDELDAYVKAYKD